MKFVDLIAFAQDLGADCLATGHYVRRGRSADGRIELWKGRDPARDQSYFLYGTTAEQLDYLRFPLGDLPKSEVRRLAAEEGLVVADKLDSQDICFVPTAIMRRWSRSCARTAAPGAIVHVDGRVLGRHEGVVHFTIGQRRGIDVGGQPEPLYVVRIEPEERRLVVGPRAALAVAAARIEGINWLAEDQREVEAKVRSLARPVPGLWDGERLTFATPGYGVAPGQSAVFYDGDRLLGGGTIVETEAASAEVAAAA